VIGLLIFFDLGLGLFYEDFNGVCAIYPFPGNGELYSKVGVPFVMGTTGGDRDLLYKTVQDSKNYAVISPQMGKQVNH
jgi:hypothetical protein